MVFYAINTISILFGLIDGIGNVQLWAIKRISIMPAQRKLEYEEQGRQAN